MQQVVGGRFLPSVEETVVASKINHGVRPVAIWDMPTRVLYGALAMRLEPSLPSVDRGQAQWAAFKRAPLDHDGSYIIATDIASCYQYIDHNILMDELLVQVGEHATVNTLGELLSTTQGRTYGIPQQSAASDLLAEVVLDRLERVLVRRGIQAARYNDDFRFTCRSWSDAVRAIEVFSEETRRHGLTMNDLKTLTWKRATYQRSLDEAEDLREEIAADAQYDLTLFEYDPYGDETGSQPPDPTDVDREAAARIIERWAKVGGRSQVATRRVKEHRALLELLPSALATLETEPTTDPETLNHLMRMLRFARQMTPAVCRYLAERADPAPVIAAFDKLLTSRAYLNEWQCWWLQSAIASNPAFGIGERANRRIQWVHAALGAQAPTPRAHAALTLARHGQINADELLRLYDRTGVTARPLLVAAIALTKPSTRITKAVTQDNPLHRWVYEWAHTSA
ncbi:Reverse transcriptase (RNA-dependent DNA polymerase) [Micromonospora cremea]|uniref:Reverse transcriptase (RNA-dependent DNA polymerase) n=1 Tax=Micromonospora cremea TaxID=709881 RepID=A0A1N5TYK7_9ACTN|nr:Reverse transcriptase (RNA-dependent DNA polymerase) [Micromonospora cremea]